MSSLEESSQLIYLPKESPRLAIKPEDKAPLQMSFLEFKCDEEVTKGQVPTDASLDNLDVAKKAFFK